MLHIESVKFHACSYLVFTASFKPQLLGDTLEKHDKYRTEEMCVSDKFTRNPPMYFRLLQTYECGRKKVHHKLPPLNHHRKDILLLTTIINIQPQCVIILWLHEKNRQVQYISRQCRVLKTTEV